MLDKANPKEKALKKCLKVKTFVPSHPEVKLFEIKIVVNYCCLNEKRHVFVVFIEVKGRKSMD